MRSMTPRGLLLALVLLFSGCPGRGPTATPALDPLAALERARQESWVRPVLGTFSIRLELPDRKIGASGLLILAPPNRFRLELRGPVGGPALVVVSDGQMLDVWLASSNTVWHAAEAEPLLRGLTGELFGLDAVVSLLGGRLPASDAWVAGPTGLTLTTPQGVIATVVLDQRGAHLMGVEAKDREGGVLLRADLVPGRDYPDRLALQIPTLGGGAELEFDAWEAYEPEDVVFRIATPPSPTVVDAGSLLLPGASPEGTDGP